MHPDCSVTSGRGVCRRGIALQRTRPICWFDIGRCGRPQFLRLELPSTHPASCTGALSRCMYRRAWSTAMSWRDVGGALRRVACQRLVEVVELVRGQFGDRDWPECRNDSLRSEPGGHVPRPLPSHRVEVAGDVEDDVGAAGVVVDAERARSCSDLRAVMWDRFHDHAYRGRREVAARGGPRLAECKGRSSVFRCGRSTLDIGCAV